MAKRSIPSMTPQEMAFVAFCHSGAYVQQFFNAGNVRQAWFSKVGVNLEFARIAVLETAHTCLVSRHFARHEREYMALFDDMKEFRSVWFDNILTNIYNYNLCDSILVVLGTLASIKRNRGELEDTRAILELDQQIIELYDQRINTPGLVHSCTTTSLQDMKENLEGLRYKYHLIWFSFLPQARSSKIVLPNFDRDIVFHFRQLVKYEIVTAGAGEGDGRHLDNLKSLMNRSSLSLKELEKLSDTKLLEYLEQCFGFGRGHEDKTSYYDPSIARKVALATCAHCQQKEEARGDFKCCGSCKRVYYCSPACQKSHWKEGGHKLKCGEK